MDSMLYVAIAALVGIAVGLLMSLIYKSALKGQKTSIEAERNKIIENAQKEAENIKKESVLEADVESVMPQPSMTGHAKAEAGDMSSLLNIRTMLVLALWYTFSFGAIFLNKYIVDMLNAEIVIFCKFLVAYFIFLAVAIIFCTDGFLCWDCRCVR